MLNYSTAIIYHIISYHIYHIIISYHLIMFCGLQVLKYVLICKWILKLFKNQEYSISFSCHQKFLLPLKTANIWNYISLFCVLNLFSLLALIRDHELFLHFSSFSAFYSLFSSILGKREIHPMGYNNFILLKDTLLLGISYCSSRIRITRKL